MINKSKYSTNSSNNNSGTNNLRTNLNSSCGFTLMETVIAISISIIILGGIVTLAVRVVKNGKFTEKLGDTNVLLTQKTTDLFNNTVGEVAKIPKGETRAGSINPEQPITGYFDITNESGCVIKSSKSFPVPIIPVEPIVEPTKGIKTSKTSNRGKFGDLGDDLGDSGDGSPLSCSTSTFKTPSNSLEPKFRRQWAVVKDFPALGDVSFSVVIVAIQTNQITMSSIITKSDGFTSK